MPQIQQDTKVARILSQQDNIPLLYHFKITSFPGVTFAKGVHQGWPIGWLPLSPDLKLRDFIPGTTIKDKV